MVRNISFTLLLLCPFCGLREKGKRDLIVSRQQDAALQVNVMQADVISRWGYNVMVERIRQQGCYASD